MPIKVSLAVLFIIAAVYLHTVLELVTLRNELATLANRLDKGRTLPEPSTLKLSDVKAEQVESQVSYQDANQQLSTLIESLESMRTTQQRLKQQLESQAEFLQASVDMLELLVFYSDASTQERRRMEYELEQAILRRNLARDALDTAKVLIRPE